MTHDLVLLEQEHRDPGGSHQLFAAPAVTTTFLGVVQLRSQQWPAAVG